LWFFDVDNPRPLSSKQLDAARHLARGRTGTQAAAAVGVRPETLSRWRQTPAFAAELRRLAELAEQGDARARAEALTRPALDVLQATLTDRRAPQALRVEAAAAVLRFAATFEGPEQ
jgi:hypothetical protein